MLCGFGGMSRLTDWAALRPRGSHPSSRPRPLLSTRSAEGMQMRRSGGADSDDRALRGAASALSGVAAGLDLESAPTGPPPGAARARPAASRRHLRTRIIRVEASHAAVPGKPFGEECGCSGRPVHLRCSRVTQPGCNQQLPAAAASSSAVSRCTDLERPRRSRFAQWQLFAWLALLLALLLSPEVAAAALPAFMSSLKAPSSSAAASTPFRVQSVGQMYTLQVLQRHNSSGALPPLAALNELLRQANGAGALQLNESAAFTTASVPAAAAGVAGFGSGLSSLSSLQLPDVFGSTLLPAAPPALNLSSPSVPAPPSPPVRLGLPFDSGTPQTSAPLEPGLNTTETAGTGLSAGTSSALSLAEDEMETAERAVRFGVYDAVYGYLNYIGFQIIVVGNILTIKTPSRPIFCSLSAMSWWCWDMPRWASRDRRRSKWPIGRWRSRSCPSASQGRMYFIVY